MSRGYWEYRNESLKEDIFGCGGEPANVFEDREISQLVWDVFGFLEDFDSYKSGDSDREAYLEAKDDFKKKWLKGNRKARLESIIDKAVDELAAELRETIK